MKSVENAHDSTNAELKIIIDQMAISTKEEEKKERERERKREENNLSAILRPSDNVRRTDNIVQISIGPRADPRNSILDRHKELLTHATCECRIFPMRNVNLVQNSLEQRQRSVDIERN